MNQTGADKIIQRHINNEILAGGIKQTNKQTEKQIWRKWLSENLEAKERRIVVKFLLRCLTVKEKSTYLRCTKDVTCLANKWGYIKGGSHKLIKVRTPFKLY